MTRRRASEVLYTLINSGILSDDMTEDLEEIVQHICYDNFEKCENGSVYCENCKFLDE